MKDSPSPRTGPGPRPRLRFFEKAANQQHIADSDKYLYQQSKPEFRLAIIGTGTMGLEHMRVATLLGRAAIHGIFDNSSLSLDTAEKYLSSLGATKPVRYADLASACSDKDVDALLICTPNFTHFDVLQEVMKSGKAIFLEKPMATSLSDAAQIVELAAKYKSVIQIGLQYRYKAQYVEAFHEALGRKSLGRIHTVSMSEYRPPFLDKVEQWNKFNQYSGGTLVEKCCHYFDLINLLAESRPATVYASGGQAVNFLDFEKDGRRSDIADHAFVVVNYANGIKANFTLNMFCPDFYEEMVIVGEHARLVATERFNFHHQQPAVARVELELGEQGASRQTDVSYPSLLEQSGHHGATYFEQFAFIDQLEGKSVDAATVDDGFWSMVVAAAAQQSMADAAVIDVEKFLSDNKLAHLLRG